MYYLIYTIIMPSSQEQTMVQVYFKIPYTGVKSVFQVKKSLTTAEFLEYVNVEVRNVLNINPRYLIEIVDTDKPDGELAVAMDSRTDETLLQRYGNRNTFITFYARPVDPITREFVRVENYSN